MNALYEWSAQAAQLGGTLYFAAIFFAIVVYALWPRNGEAFAKAARIPLEDDER